MRTAALTLACVLIAGAPAAAAPLGAPRLRVATLRDTLAHRSAYQEWWHIRAVSPRSDAFVTLTFWRDHDGEALLVRGGNPRTQQIAETVFDGGRVGASSRGLSAGPTARVRFGRRTAAISLTGRTTTGQVALRHLRPGPAAFGFDLGRETYRPDLVSRANLSWSMPIADSVARGSVDIRGTKLDLNGWRVSYEHTWGNLLWPDTAWDYFDDWVVHSGGVTWVAFGINRMDTATKPGALDSSWLGALARVDRNGTSVCRPRVHRTNWIYRMSDYEHRYAGNMDARCGRMGVALRSQTSLSITGDMPHTDGEATPARIGSRGRGWVVHRVNESP